MKRFTQILGMMLLMGCLGGQAAWAQTTYYISPGGEDSNAGTSAEQPLGTFEAAVTKLKPGDTLVLLDGTYTPDNAGMLTIKNKSGAEDAPITVRAQNERRAWIKSDGREAPIAVHESAWWVFEGIRASSADNKEGGTPDFDNMAHSGNVVDALRSDHITFRRLLLHHPNRYGNSHVIGMTQCHHMLIEEVEGYNFHRHGVTSLIGDHITIRRTFMNAREAPTPEGSGLYTGHGCCRKAGDEGYSFYFTSNSILENSVSMHTEGLSIIAAVATPLGNPGGQNNKILGNISYKDLRPGGFLQSRKFVNDAADRYGGFTGPVKNILYKDILIVGGQTLDEGGDFSWSVAQGATIEGATFVNFKNDAPLTASAGTRGNESDPEEHRLFLGCGREEVGGCDYDVRNALFLNNEYKGEGGALLDMEPPKDVMDLLVAYSNAWSQDAPEKGFGVGEDISDDAGQYQQSMSVKPTGLGLGEGECIAFVSERSNMSGAGSRGNDIGANILYRYEDGELTDEPLWDPETGEYPHGAVIAGSPNDPDEHAVTAASIHRHLNVNANGCQLPYDGGASSSAR